MGYEQDRAFARRVCRELEAGNWSAFEELYQRYHPYLVRFAAPRLFEPGRVGDAVSEFWLRLVDRGLLGRYAGRSALSTYLTGILFNVVRDFNRDTVRRRGGSPPKKGKKKTAVPGGDARSDAGKKETAPSSSPGRTGALKARSRPPGPVQAGDDALRREAVRPAIRRTVHRALLALSDEHPRCAWILWMRLSGLQYAEIARIEGAVASPDAREDPGELTRRTNAIKKLATRRDPPGCEARFRRLFVKLLREKERLEPEDVL